MAILDVSVSRFSLAVDAYDTIDIVVDNADNPWGRRLHDALTFAAGTRATFAVAPYVRTRLEDFRPDAPGRSNLPEVADRSTVGVLANLEKSGIVVTHTVWSETASESYLSDGRVITAVQVLRPFALVSVEYRFTRRANDRLWPYGPIYADEWSVVGRSYIVPAGWYLVGEAGDLVMDLVGVAGIDGVSEDTAMRLVGLEGFEASRCASECAACGASWSADGGSWHFRANDGSAAPWEFDDAEDFEPDDTVSCPTCRTGRVHFMIF